MSSCDSFYHFNPIVFHCHSIPFTSIHSIPFNPSIQESISSRATVTKMLVFRHKQPHERQGPRIWNDMIYKFAGHKMNDNIFDDINSNNGKNEKNQPNEILGDPANVEFTSTLKEKFKWKTYGPPTAYDVLPLLLQVRAIQPRHNNPSMVQ